MMYFGQGRSHRLFLAVTVFVVQLKVLKSHRMRRNYWGFKFVILTLNMQELQSLLKEKSMKNENNFFKSMFGMDWLFATFIFNVFRFQIFKEKKQNDKQWIVLSFAISENINQNLNWKFSPTNSIFYPRMPEAPRPKVCVRKVSELRERGKGGRGIGIFFDISFLLHYISCLPQFEIFKITDFNGRERESLKVNCIGAMGKFARYFSPVSPSTKAAHNVCWLVEKFIVEPPAPAVEEFLELYRAACIGWFNWFSKYFLCWPNQQLSAGGWHDDRSSHCSKWKIFSVSQQSRPVPSTAGAGGLCAGLEENMRNPVRYLFSVLPCPPPPPSPASNITLQNL